MVINQTTKSPMQQHFLLLIGNIDPEVQKLWDLLSQQGYWIEHFYLEQVSKALIRSPRPNLILLTDHLIQDSFKTCQELSQSAQFAKIPIIFLCVHPNSLNRSKIFQAGAVDYLFAPFIADEVFSRIDHHLMTNDLSQKLELKERQLQQKLADFQVIESSLHQVNQELAESSFLDLSTQLLNRQKFEQDVAQEWRKSTRDRILWGDSRQTTLSVLVTVIDNFGEYIQQCGEDQAENALKTVGTLIKNAINRPADIVARYNEIVIAVLLPNTPQEGALRVAEKVRQSIDQSRLTHPLQPYLTLSFGIISAIPSQALATDVLFVAIEELLSNSLIQGHQQLICDSL